MKKIPKQKKATLTYYWFLTKKKILSGEKIDDEKAFEKSFLLFLENLLNS